VVKAVQDKGGLFLLQLWHVGRASHTGRQGVTNTTTACSYVLCHQRANSRLCHLTVEGCRMHLVYHDAQSLDRGTLSTC